MIFKETESPYILTIIFNNKNLGELIQLEDGKWVWFPPNFDGTCISSWLLKDIYNKLEDLNKTSS